MIAVQNNTPFSKARRRLFSKRSPRFHDVYELGKLIKEGGSGTVFQASLKGSETSNFAVKVIDRTNLSNEAEKMILREIDIMREVADLKHTNKVVDVFVSRKTIRIVQELASGGDLQDWVIHHGAYNEADARVLTTVLLNTIQELHTRGVVHRDIKLANILLEIPQNNSLIALADWGYADRFESGQTMTKACGTPTCIAPEVLADDPSYTEMVDLWGAGCVVYTILSGRAPFVLSDNESWDDLFQRIRQGQYRSLDHKGWTGVSDEAKEFVRGLLNVDPSKRWSAEEALQSAWIMKKQRTS